MADRAEIVADIVKCKEASSDSSVIVRASRFAKLPANIAASDGVVAIGPAPICPDPDVSAAAAAPRKGSGFTMRTLCKPDVFAEAWLKVMPDDIRQGMHVELPLAVQGWETPEHFWIEVASFERNKLVSAWATADHRGFTTFGSFLLHTLTKIKHLANPAQIICF